MPSANSPHRPSAPMSTSGIQTLSTGHSIIPASLRPDGTTRKEIKVRPGYRPPEDQEKYRNKIVEAYSKIGTGGVPGAEPTGTPAKGAEEKNKNAKRREATRKKAAASAAEAQVEDLEIRDITNGVQKTQLQASETEKLKQSWRDPAKLVMNKDAAVEAEEEEAAAAAAAAAAAEKEKKARNLKKKLRQARELKEKKEGGGELLPEQLAKVTKIQELIRDLDKLGYDAEGEPKATGVGNGQR